MDYFTHIQSLKRCHLSSSNKHGFLLIEVLIALSIMSVLGSLIMSSILSLFSTTHTALRSLQDAQSLLFIHDVFEDDLSPSYVIQSCSDEHLYISHSTGNTIEYTFSRGRIGRSYNSKRREFINPELFLRTFSCTASGTLTTLSLMSHSGTSYEMYYAAE